MEFFVAISCYFSPNGDITDFETLLEDIERVIRGSAKEIILGGDLNAKTTLLGSLITNRRGQILEDWLAKNSFVVINNGRTPTFSNANGSSYIDITATTPKISSRTRNWTVDVEYENFSDHRLIHFEIFFPPTTIFQTISMKEFKTKCVGMLQKIKMDSNQSAKHITEITTETCNKTLPKKKNRRKVTLPFTGGHRKLVNYGKPASIKEEEVKD